MNQPPTVAKTTPPLDSPDSSGLGVSWTVSDLQRRADPVHPHFQIRGELGQGGMGKVYKAYDPRLERELALKIILPTAFSFEARRRLEAEAKILAKLPAEHFVQIFERDTTPMSDGTNAIYIAMELCHGGGLEDAIRENPPTVSQSIALVAKLARAMAEAHAKGIIHRDLKPGNILLVNSSDSRFDKPKIADFGLARELGKDNGTNPGAIMGTPSYMAPEQAEGRDVERPADVWALGVILYRLLSQQLPFTGDSTMKVLQAIGCTEPKPLCELVPGLPPVIGEIVRDCLKKAPADRSTMTELAQRLETYLAERQQVTQAVAPIHGPSRRMTFGMVLAIALLVGCGLWMWVSWRPKAKEGGTGDEVREAVSGGQVSGQPKANESGTGENAPSPIQVRALRVNLFRPEQDGDLPVGEIGNEVTKTRFGDVVTIEVELSQECYFYVVALNTDGKEQLLWPAGESEVPTKSKQARMPLRSPTTGKDQRFKLNDNVDGGLQAFAVLASTQPLQSWRKWRVGRPTKWQIWPAGLNVWQADVKGSYPIVRGKRGLEDREGPSLSSVCEGYTGDGVEVVELLAFPVGAKQ